MRFEHDAVVAVLSFLHVFTHVPVPAPHQFPPANWQVWHVVMLKIYPVCAKVVAAVRAKMRTSLYIF
jgi:hypothetical protein